MELEPILKLSRDIKNSAGILSINQAKFLVSNYYKIQDYRLSYQSQIRQLSKSEEPHEIFAWLFTQAETLEKQIQGALDKYSMSSTLGRWARDIYGIGPVITAGLLAHIDIHRAPTAGHLWSFAGLNPKVKWNKSQLRPWNAALKELCFHAGESFVKFFGNEKCFYGKLYLERKAEELEKNYRGEFAAQAEAALNEKTFGDDTVSLLFYSGCFTADAARQIFECEEMTKRLKLVKDLKGEPMSGIRMLSPAHIHNRAKRFAVKIFLSHYHEMAFNTILKEAAPYPYPIEHLGHAHKVEIPGRHPNRKVRFGEKLKRPTYKKHGTFP
jgi:hypothetical protein